LSCGIAAGQESFAGWNLEPSLGQAHLVMVARVVSIGRLTVVTGAKTDVALREYRFQPVRRLRGIFQREQLSMTAADLGCPADDAAVAPPLREGELRLLILVQQPGGAVGCVAAGPGASTFEQRVPLLRGLDDGLIATAETLIRVADSRSRRERARLLLDRLEQASGVSAVPLLTSVRLRADWAALDGRALPALERLARDPSLAVRAAACGALREVLSHVRPAPDFRPPAGLAAALRAILEADGSRTELRLAAMESLGHLRRLGAEADGERDWLIGQLQSAATHAERAAAARALSRATDPPATAAVLGALAGLPLDEPASSSTTYARAAVQLDAAGAERVLLVRLERLIQAGQPLGTEVAALGRLRSQASVPLLLAAAGQQGLAAADRNQVAWALGRLGDDRGVPVLTNWLRGNDYALKELALAALESIDSPAAAREARPLLKSEPYLPFKLRLARLLARQQLADGYSLATEHLADTGHTADASLVLAALGDPRTGPDLQPILAARPDRQWHAAVLSGLAAVGDAAARQQLLEILADDRHALSAAAAEAAGVSAGGELLLPLSQLTQSRNKQLALAALLALRRSLCDVRSSPRGLAAVVPAAAISDEDELVLPAVEVPAATQAAISAAVAALVTDAYVDADVRQEAFAVARMLAGERLTRLLAELADQAELEGTPLLAAAQAEVQRRSRGPQ
jgi:hypothetical protein